jgi:hypothetical protein
MTSIRSGRTPRPAPRHRAPTAAGRLRLRVLAAGPAGPSDRGDVPGWVLVTLMSALLVVALLGVARTELVSVFQNAIGSVSSP